jgi:hypothetical protein
VDPEDTAEHAVCACGTRLQIVGPPPRLGESAIFTVRCLTCHARVRLTHALAGIRQVTIAAADGS